MVAGVAISAHFPALQYLISHTNMLTGSTRPFFLSIIFYRVASFLVLVPHGFGASAVSGPSRPVHEKKVHYFQTDVQPPVLQSTQATATSE